MNNIFVTGAVSYDGLLYVTIVQEEIEKNQFVISGCL